MAMKRFATVALLALVFAAPAYAWSGTDEEGNSVEIDSGNLVRTGDDITYYNDADGEDHAATVDDIARYGNEVVIDVTDDDTGYEHTLTMEDE